MSETTKRVRPILRWPGGKRRMLKHLLPMIPEHVCYAEAFAGGLAMLLAKPRSEVEIINDINGDLVALYRNLQYHLPELNRELDFMLGSRQMLRDFVVQPGITEIQRAARFLLRNRISFGGGGTSFGVTKSGGGGAAFSHPGCAELLGDAHERMDKVIVENLPYQRFLNLYDTKNTFFFLDPPYVNADPHAYRGWTENEMREFRECVSKLKAKWIVTVDDSKLNRELFRDCKLQEVRTKNGCTNNRTHSEVTFGELIITAK